MHSIALLWTTLLSCLVYSFGGLLSRQWIRTTQPRDYYSQFDLDYGCEDNTRPVGKTHGVLNQGGFDLIKSDNQLFRWFTRYLAHGSDHSPGRLRPFHAVDIGTREDRATNPLIMVMNDQLEFNEKGELINPTSDANFEVREIWQPWLRHRCNFAVRYIVPNRVNILKIMENNGQFRSWIEKSKVANSNGGTKTEVKVKCSVSPVDWFSKYFRGNSVEMQIPIDVNRLLIDRKEL